ncbi:MAG: flagellar motor switch phosphatase FliY, partial [Oscillospiraceae bacterium]|nr:flagellar motor switch phosphatase FliY [Oscillospiraceae bacterium]
MGEVLSQAELDALLSGFYQGGDEAVAQDGGAKAAAADPVPAKAPSASGRGGPVLTLSPMEMDALGEIGNISMGTSATTLVALLGHKVTITTPKVTVTTWEELCKNYGHPFVAVRIEYTKGLSGSNLLILNMGDAQIITNLMLGLDPMGGGDEGLNEIHMSAISEAMNQMMGSSATSMSSIFSKKVDISPPTAFNITFESLFASGDYNDGELIAKISFDMEIEGLLKSEIMQLLPMEFAKSLVQNLMESHDGSLDGGAAERGPSEASQQSQAVPGGPASQPAMAEAVPQPMPAPMPQPMPAPMPAPMPQP